MVWLKAIAAAALTMSAPAAALSEPGPVEPTTTGAYEMRIRLVPKAQRVPIAFERVNGVIVVPVEVRRQKVWAMIDNGMPLSLIDVGFASRLNLRLSEPTKPLLIPTGKMEHRRTEVAEILLPGMAAASLPLSAVDLSFPSKAARHEIGIVIGADLLKGLAVYVRNSNNTLELGPSGSARIPEGVQTVSLYGRFNQLELVLNGSPLRLNLDLGYNGEIALTNAAWNRIPELTVKGSQPNANLDGRWIRQEFGFAKNVRLATLSLERVRVSKLAQGKQINDEANADGYLGAGFLKRFNYVLDVSAGKLHLIPIPMPESTDSSN